MIKVIAISIIALIGLMDYALCVACSHMEDREAWRREHEDE